MSRTALEARVMYADRLMQIAGVLLAVGSLACFGVVAALALRYVS